ncbi:hypothetical protein CYLTODRAFT_492208 [Cylindrobasidium torrendii FP15055 ss-10]|uniref:Uncharacterized protein n=1 Tax=Cylindrobasidium torrendii FP15055 ss-10 TaxID=1314674 RepID=A0A0D7B7T6_9AGAR|nr:hypothetical protein CYLTODRAFT_492208 [Cylindrobasidium torrendii FP15055 ss-10]
MCFTNIYAPKPKRSVDILAMQKIINWVELATEENFPSPVLPNNLLPPCHNQPAMWASENTDGPTTSGIQEDAWRPSPALHRAIDNDFDSDAQPSGLLFSLADAAPGQPFGGQAYTDPPSPTDAHVARQSFAQLPYFGDSIGRPLQPVPLPDVHTLYDERDYELNAPAFLGSALAFGSFASSGSTSTAAARSALTSEDRARALQAVQDLDLNALSDQEADQFAAALMNRLRRGQIDYEQPAKIQRPLGRSAGRSVGQLHNAQVPTNVNGSVLNKRKRDDMDMDEDENAVF